MRISGTGSFRLDSVGIVAGHGGPEDSSAATAFPTSISSSSGVAGAPGAVGAPGDGFFALFDGPARAIRCALALVHAVRPLGLEIRAGLHTGEVELAGDDVEGLAIHIGARIAALAGTGEVLVSRTIKDLVVGSGLTFRDRGIHALKGVPDQWQLFAAAIT